MANQLAEKIDVLEHTLLGLAQLYDNHMIIGLKRGFLEYKEGVKAREDALHICIERCEQDPKLAAAVASLPGLREAMHATLLSCGGIEPEEIRLSIK